MNLGCSNIIVFVNTIEIIINFEDELFAIILTKL